MPLISYAGKTGAPEFREGLEWLNAGRPLSLKDLRGKIVLLDFWTHCCINCIHALVDLKRLEAKYPSELVVIGVHSGKFTAERDTRTIREAILKYDIGHPVVNDRDFEIWNAYSVSAWPSFVIIDPEGRIVGKHSGEDVFDLFDRIIRGMIREFDMLGKMDRSPLPFAHEKERGLRTLLSFPGKIASDGARLFISDSDHNRIVIMSLGNSAVLDAIGEGRPGLRDGRYEYARFNRPQGVAVAGGMLYVADTGNHAIRRVDLAAREVFTLAGTGKQAHRFNVSGKGRGAPLNSPWDLLVHEGLLYIAMAGPHQLWTLDLETLEVQPYAGTGREDIVDDYLSDAALAQPSGITTDGKRLYFADSETSSIRSADLFPGGRVETIVGAGLFEYGDRDGAGAEVRLQHPLGVLWHDGLLYVADTYNNKIKKIDPGARRSETFIGTGKPGMKDGPAGEAELNEPEGLAYAEGKLYIADTHNHSVRVFDFGTGRVATVQLQDTDKLAAPLQRPGDPFQGKEVEFPEETIAAGEGALDIFVRFFKGYKLNRAAPLYASLFSKDSAVVRAGTGPVGQDIYDPVFPIRLPAVFAEGKTMVTVDLIIYYCREEQESLCFIKHFRALVPVHVSRSSIAHTISIDVTVDEPG